VADLKLSDDGLFYWDGRQWVTTLSPDGRFRWNGSAWVPVGGMAPPAAYYQPPATPRLPTQWTKPMQYAVAGWYVVSGLFALTVPFWMSGRVTDIMNRAIQQQTSLNPTVSPPPPEFVSAMSSMMSGILWVAAVFGVAISTVAIMGALKRWTWMFYVVLVLLGLGVLGLPYNIVTLVSERSTLSVFTMPPGFIWLSIGFGLGGTALFVWMLIAVIRYGPWAMAKKVDQPAPATPPPAS
jgi:MFS family permease